MTMKVKTTLRNLVLVAAALCGATWLAAERADIYVERGTGYTLLYTQGEYIAGFGVAVPTVRTSAVTAGHAIPNNAFFYRTDLGTFYTQTAGTWSALSLSGQTLATPAISAPAFSGTATGTLTSLGLVSPVVTGTAGSGFSITKRCTLTETGVAGPYTCTIPVPAGAVIEDIQVIGRVLWNGTSASLLVGDTADPNGFFDTVNLKATDLVIGEMLSVKHGDLWGGQEGAYLVAASGVRGPTTSNFSMSYVAGSNILFAVTAGAADGSTGRTDCVVIYSTPEVIAQTTS
jgi:hypothetical protein